jgi:hypothetical protein
MTIKCLIATEKDRTMYEDRTMEPSVKKLVDEWESVRRSRLAMDQRLNAIETALTIMGIRVDDRLLMMRGEVQASRYVKTTESRYVQEKPFRHTSLSEGCLMVLEDHRDMGIRLDKGQIEYLLVLGGHQFKAKDPTNSVDVTLRRLASDGKCEVEKGAGPHGNRYRANRNKGETDNMGINATLSRTTKTTTEER